VLYTQLQPYFEKAFQAKEVQPETYVNNLTKIIGFHEKNNEKLDAIHDSLCVIYKCQPMQVIRRLEKGDSVIIRTQLK
jgi:hypothetical protein